MKKYSVKKLSRMFAAFLMGAMLFSGPCGFGPPVPRPHEYPQPVPGESGQEDGSSQEGEGGQEASTRGWKVERPSLQESRQS